MYELLKTQKNEVFKLLQDKGFETANFSWKQHTICEPIYQDPNIIVPRLEYLDGQYYFQFESHSCTFSPGVLELTELNEDIDTWLGKRHLVELWTIYLKREIEAPDLWTEMEKYKTSVSLAIPEQLLNEPIPATEVQEIASKLSLLTGKIKEQFELTDEQNQFVRGKLDYLAGAAKRQRSADWVHTSIGVFVTIAMALALAPDRAKELWQLIESIVGQFIHLISS